MAKGRGENGIRIELMNKPMKRKRTVDRKTK